jgi:hypothetical protein
MSDVLASVFCRGRFVGSILHRGRMGYEAIGPDGVTPHGHFPSQREAAPWSWTTQNGWCIRRQDLNRWRRAVEEGRHAPP